MKFDKLTIRRGTLKDSYSAFLIFEETLAAMVKKYGSSEPTSIADPQALARMWDRRRSFYDYLARTADEFWLAEIDDRPVGFSRSVIREDVLILTEFFVLPTNQTAGVGKALLEKAFGQKGLPHRSILATLDPNAQTLYLRDGVYPRFPVFYFGRNPRKVSVDTDLEFMSIVPTPGQIKELARLDRNFIGFEREMDHQWMATDRQGYIYTRNGQAVGYGYAGVANGPFLLSDPADFPAALAHAENQALERGFNHFGLEVPMINVSAVDYLVSQKFRMDPFVTVMMNNRPFADFTRYIIISPPFLL